MNDKEKKAFVARMKKGKKDAAKNKKKKAYAYKRKYLSRILLRNKPRNCAAF